ncbi:MAG: hypothetical protein WDW36_002597 [Sanguina aurantia]
MSSFSDTGLDPRLLRALTKRGLSTPTAVQRDAIPKTLEGKDVVARARTGSGKTLAYLLPALHRILSTEPLSGSFKAIVLVPTRELCEQVKSEAMITAQLCSSEITATALLGETSQQLRRAVATAGQIVVATPGRLAEALKGGFLSPATLAARLQMLVLDEADLLLSYGYEEDLQLIAPHVPRSCQCILMSATISDDVERLQKLVLHNPITLNLLHTNAAAAAAVPGAAPTALSQGSGVSASIEHFAVVCAKEDRLLYVMATLKLGLLRKKVLVFVNCVDDGFRLKLFLESFGLRAALLNAELPLNSRSHILAAFNKGLFDYLIATDDVHAPAHDSQQTGKKGARVAGVKRKRKDEEFGVTRGIDFKGVRTIINFGLPSSVAGYVHRVGRTGRAGESGSALTLFTPNDLLFQCELEAVLNAERAGQSAASAAAGGSSTSGRGDGVDDSDDDGDDDGLVGEAGRAAAAGQSALKPFLRLPTAQVDALRYRGEDIARSLTKAMIKEARARELRIELLNSAKLKEYFEDHGAERLLLRHDKALHKAPQAPHLKHIPAYIRDPSVITERSSAGGAGRGVLGRKKQRSQDAGRDPLKAAGTGFLKAPKKGGAANEQLTDIERKAAKKGRKDAKIRAKTEVAPVYKGNVRKQSNNFKRR